MQSAINKNDKNFTFELLFISFLFCLHVTLLIGRLTCVICNDSLVMTHYDSCVFRPIEKLQISLNDSFV